MELKELLIQYSEHAKFNHLNDTDQIGINVWLIYVNSEEGSKELFRVLETSPLRFDSQIYEFYEESRGKTIRCIRLDNNRYTYLNHSKAQITNGDLINGIIQ